MPRRTLDDAFYSPYTIIASNMDGSRARALHSFRQRSLRAEVGARHLSAPSAALRSARQRLLGSRKEAMLHAMSRPGVMRTFAVLVVTLLAWMLGASSAAAVTVRVRGGTT